MDVSAHLHIDPAGLSHNHFISTKELPKGNPQPISLSQSFDDEVLSLTALLGKALDSPSWSNIPQTRYSAQTGT